MKKLFLLALVLTLASCGQNNVTDTNTGVSISTEKVETQVVDKNVELRERLEKMAEEYAKTQKYTSFAEFEKVTGLNLGNDAEVLLEDKGHAGVGVILVKNDFVFFSTTMGKGGAGHLYQLKDGKMEFVIGGNGDAPEAECKKLDELGVPAEFPVKRLYCNYEKNSDKNAELRAKLEKMAEEYTKNEKYASFADFENATGLKLGDDAEILPEDKENAGVAVGLVKEDFVLMSASMGKGGRISFYQLQDGKMEFIIGGNGDAPIEQCEKFDSLNVPAEFSRVKEQLCNYER